MNFYKTRLFFCSSNLHKQRFLLSCIVLTVLGACDSTTTNQAPQDSSSDASILDVSTSESTPDTTQPDSPVVNDSVTSEDGPALLDVTSDSQATTDGTTDSNAFGDTAVDATGDMSIIDAPSDTAKVDGGAPVGAPKFLLVASYNWVLIDLSNQQTTDYANAGLPPTFGATNNLNTPNGEDWDVSTQGLIVTTNGGHDDAIVVVPFDKSAAGKTLVKRNMANNPNWQFVTMPHFSSDGNKIYFVAGGPGQDGQIYSVDAYGPANQTPVAVYPASTPSAAFQPFGARWNNSGTHIIGSAFNNNLPPCTGTNCSPTHVGLLEVATGKVTKLTADVNGMTYGQQNYATTACTKLAPGCLVSRNGAGAFMQPSETEFGWLPDGRILVGSNRDQYLTSQTGIPQGNLKLLAYDPKVPVAFDQWPAHTTITSPVQLAHLPRAVSRDNKLWASVNAKLNGSSVLQVHLHDANGTLKFSTTNFNAANVPKGVRFVY